MREGLFFRPWIPPSGAESGLYFVIIFEMVLHNAIAFAALAF